MKLELRGITKRFGSFVANDQVNLIVQPGEIHCLLGENGAGKTTLMNVLYGLTPPSEGEILVNDAPVTISDPKHAVALGIGMVHQHFMLVPVFSVAENVILGDEPTSPWPLIDYKSAVDTLIRLSAEYEFSVDPTATVEDLPIGTQQRVEILKALSHDAELLILDEPTAVLTPQEADALMVVMRTLKAQGKSIVFITHKLKEVLAIADSITVMRAGSVVGTTTPSSADEESLASMMVGRSVALRVDKVDAEPGETRLAVTNLYAEDDRGLTAVKGVSFELRAGEILAVAGVQGNGQTELVEVLTGLRRATSGVIEVEGRPVHDLSVKGVIESGVAHVPEDRQEHGLILSLSIADNLVLDRLDDPQFSRWGARRLGAIRENGRRLLGDFDIRARDEREVVGTLSGGNQQKVVLAREFSREFSVLICAQPTRGLDVGSIEFVHQQIVRKRDAGAAVLIVSSELDEVLALGDRIAVMYDGRIQGIVPSTTSREEIGLMMAGATTALTGTSV